MSAMTDRELLELAAKAAGLMHTPTKSKLGLFLRDEFGSTSLWNPLEDDGYALRLAVKLGLLVNCEVADAESVVIATGIHEKERHGTDPYAATRRAIVRAAAEIGAKS